MEYNLWVKKWISNFKQPRIKSGILQRGAKGKLRGRGGVPNFLKFCQLVLSEVVSRPWA